MGRWMSTVSFLSRIKEANGYHLFTIAHPDRTATPCRQDASTTGKRMFGPTHEQI